MATTKRPDVTVSEVLARPTAGNGLPTDAVMAMIGLSSRGPIVPTLVRNWSEFTTQFGGFESSADLSYAAYLYFGNNGGPLYVSRVYGAGAVTATRSLTDTNSTPQPTLSVSAANPGVWGNSLYITINTGTVAGSFDLIVKYGSTATSSQVEQFQGLSMDPTSSRYAPTYIASYSKYIRVADLGSTSSLSQRAPSAQTDSVLATGTDGSAVSGSDYTAAAARFDLVTSPLVIAIPGYTNSTALTTIIQNAATSGKNFIVVDAPQYTTTAAYATFTATLPVSDYAAVYGPWLKIQDPSKTNVATTKLVAPSGAVLGRYSSTDQTEGVFQSPAGVSAGRLLGVADVEITFSNTDLDTLNSQAGPMNVIRPLPNRGICIMGVRTLDTSAATRYISNRRSLIYIKTGLRDLLQFALFEPNDQDLWDSIVSQSATFLSAFRGSGGLAGNDDQSAFFVTCDDTNNTALTVANGTVVVDAGVALEYPAEFINFRLGLFEGGASVTESLS